MKKIYHEPHEQHEPVLRYRGVVCDGISKGVEL